INILDKTQLAKFGLNIKGSPDSNTLTEKWEGLGLIPNLSTPEPDDFYLLVGNDNDFLASHIIHNGAEVGTSPFTQANMMLAYDVTLPGAAPQNPPDSLPTWCFLASAGGLALYRRVARGGDSQVLP